MLLSTVTANQPSFATLGIQSTSVSLRVMPCSAQSQM